MRLSIRKVNEYQTEKPFEINQVLFRVALVSFGEPLFAGESLDSLYEALTSEVFPIQYIVQKYDLKVFSGKKALALEDPKLYENLGDVSISWACEGSKFKNIPQLVLKLDTLIQKVAFKSVKDSTYWAGFWISNPSTFQKTHYLMEVSPKTSATVDTEELIIRNNLDDLFRNFFTCSIIFSDISSLHLNSYELYFRDWDWDELEDVKDDSENTAVKVRNLLNTYTDMEKSAFIRNLLNKAGY